MAKNYYSVLGVAQNSTSGQIRERFLKLARERHPDRFADSEKVKAEADFQEITEAFNILNSPESRRLHDIELVRSDKGRDGGGDQNQAVRVYLQRGVKAYREGDYESAAESFERATREDPESPSAWHNLARACRRHPRLLPRASAAIARACELKPIDATYNKLAGDIFAEAGMRGRAEHHYREALKWGGDSPRIRERLEELARGRARRGGVFGKIS